METYRVWEGERTFLPGDDTSKYKVFEIVADELGWFEDVNPEGFSGQAYYVYQTAECEIVIHIVRRQYGLGNPSYGSIHRYRSLEEAAKDGFEQVLREMRLI